MTDNVDDRSGKNIRAGRSKMQKFILLATVVISVLSSFSVFIYLTRFVGWDNLFHLLPSELAVAMLWLVFPLIIGGVIYFVMEMMNKVDTLLHTIDNQTGTMAEMVHQVATAVDESRKSRETQYPAGDIQALLARVFAGVIEAQGGFHPPVTQSKGRIDVEKLDPNDFTHLGTLINLLNVALNDLSVITTRLLILLLEDTGRDKEDVRAFVAGLLDAYGSGDKNVFFRAMKQQLDASPAYRNALKKLTINSTDVRRDVSKILREAEEIMSMVQRCDRQNLIRIVFEEGDLWALQQVLSRHFDNEGNLRI